MRLVSDQKVGVWQLLAPFSFASDLTGKTYTAPIGFKSDGMSVPRLVGFYDELGNRGRMAGVIHDALYQFHLETREICDQILREMLLIDGFTDIQAQECYLAVRAAGGSHY